MYKKGWQPEEYKGVNDEIKQQHMKTKDMDFKGKLNYFWYYYKIHTFAAIIIVIFVSIFIHDMVTAKDYNFYGVMLNSSYLDEDALEASFGEYAGLDLETYDCFIDTASTFSFQSMSEYDIATLQKLTALIQTKDLDVLVLDPQVMSNFSGNGMLLDLRNVLNKEELAKYEGSIYYIDYAEVLKAEDEDTSVSSASAEDGTPDLEEIAAEAETHKHPETMTDPIPVGIFIDESPLVQKTDCYGQLIPIYSISVTCQRTDTAVKYLDYIWDETVPFENMFVSY